MVAAHAGQLKWWREFSGPAIVDRDGAYRVGVILIGQPIASHGRSTASGSRRL